MFERWQTFNQLLGTATAALVGLLFVVASLTKNLERHRAERGTSIYMSPIVFHMSAILLLSAVALVPDIMPGAFYGAVTAVALVGIGLAVWIVIGIRRQPPAEHPHWTDPWLYGVGPGLLYLCLAAVGITCLLGSHDDPLWYSAVVIALMLLSIRNAWDLVTFLAQELDANDEAAP